MNKNIKVTPKTPSLNEAPEVCEICLKPVLICICIELTSVPNKVKVLILQHPQEPDKLLGTAKLTQLSLANSDLKIGLSWSNLKKVTQDHRTVPTEWAVLYYGSGLKIQTKSKAGLYLVDKKGVPLDLEKQSKLLNSLKGLIVLDGTWAQAKALWWRNAWLLKLQRLVLIPETTSMYGKLRREPKRECLSSLESVALTLSQIEKKPELYEHLTGVLKKFLVKVKSMPAET